MPKKKWRKETLDLKANHTWKAPDGYRIFVADRGAARFNIPEGWVIVPEPDSIQIYDLQPPADNCRLAFSYLRLPPIDWSGLPLSELIRTAILDDPRGLTCTQEAVKVPREDLEVAWAEFRFTDPNELREACTRTAMGRGGNLQALLTFDFWPEGRERFEPVWDEVMRSLELGRYIKDPTAGDVLH